MLKQRSSEKELMDLGHDFYSPDEYRQCLRILFKINKLMGFFKHTVKLLRRFPKNIVLADVGCGGGLFLLHLNHYYPQMSMLGIDISEEAIALAQSELALWKEKNAAIKVAFQLQRQPELELVAQQVDVILLTLVCHHLENEALVSFLQKAYVTVNKALIINDLHRHSIAYWFYKMGSTVLFRNRLITHDGLISIKRGFTRGELKDILQRANIHKYQIKWHFPFRWSVLVLK